MPYKYPRPGSPRHRKNEAIAEALYLDLNLKNPQLKPEKPKRPKGVQPGAKLGPYRRREFNNQKSIDIIKYVNKVSRA